MDKHKRKLQEIDKFITDYVQWTQQRGKMYGSLAQLESNWKLLDTISLIILDKSDKIDDVNFSLFLMEKGFGSRSAARTIEENESENPYEKLNILWNEYLGWRNKKLGHEK
jgi:type IV secretory pathway TrbF-like protein